VTSGSGSPFLSTSEVYPEDNSQLLIQLTSIYTATANAVNTREIGIYQDGIEGVTGQQFSSPGASQDFRPVYRKAFYFGGLASGATKTIAHGLTGVTAYTNIYGTIITDVVDYRPLPYVNTSAVGNQISLLVDATNIIIVSGATAPNVTSGIVILEYLYA
jgi:hypothetical protein